MKKQLFCFFKKPSGGILPLFAYRLTRSYPLIKADCQPRETILLSKNAPFSNRFRAFGFLQSIYNIVNPSQTLANSYFQNGNAFLKQGKFFAAIEAYSFALKYEPRHASARSNKGVALQKIGHHELAIKQFEQAIQLKRDYFDAYYNKGLSYYTLGKFKEAVSCFDNALQLKSNDFNTYYNKALALIKLNLIAEAAESLKSALHIEPSNNQAFDLFLNLKLQLGFTYEHLLEEIAVLENSSLAKRS